MNSKRIRFLASTMLALPGILFVYSPMLAILTLVGVATPFATGRLVDALAYHRPPFGAFVALVALLLFRALTAPLLQRFVCSCSRTILSIAFMAFFPLAIFLFSPFARRFAKNSHRVRRQGDTSFGALFDFLMSLPQLRVLGAERRFADIPGASLSALKKSNDETDTLSVRFGFLLGMLLVGGEIAVLGFAGALAAKGAIPVGDVVLYQMLFITAIQSVQGVIGLLPDLAALREGVDSLTEALGRTPPDNGRERIDYLATLSFHHVTFAYPGAPDRLIIRDFSAQFSAGTVVGLSGANGAGKSTLFKLAVNALEPRGGEIRINGRLVSEIDLASFRRRVGIVFQDNLLVPGTIRDNITLRDSAFTDGDIDQNSWGQTPTELMFYKAISAFFASYPVSPDYAAADPPVSAL